MVLQGCALNYGTVYLAPVGIANSRSPKSSRLLQSPTKIGFPCTKTSWAPLHNLSSNDPGIQRGYLSYTKPRLPNLSPRAYPKDVKHSSRYPEKVRWWWRMLACLPYLKPLHEIWIFAESSYHIHPFLEDLEVLTYPFWESYSRLPSWVLMGYNVVAYLGIAKRKECPYFFRSHLMMGLLFETATQIVGAVSRYLPHSVYLGKLGMHFWSAVSFAFLLMVFECVCRALTGALPDVPFFGDAAYLHVPE